MKNKPLASIFLIVFIDLLGFSLILPLLPYYAEAFGASDTVVGLLVASYAAAQLIGAPILGRLSDRFGRRPVLIVSQIGTLIGFIFLAVAEPAGKSLAGFFSSGAANVFVIGVLFFSRILDGLTGGNISVAQAYISDVTDAKNRSKGLGMIGAAFGLGFIIGPATGGVLSQWGYALPAIVAAALVAINLTLVFFWLPESLTPERRANLPEKKPAVTLNALLNALKRPFTGPLLITRFFFGLAFAILQTIFALYALRKFGLEARDTGFILTYVGLISVFIQGYLVGKLTQVIQEDVLIFASIGIMAVSLLGWALAPSVWILLIVLAPISASGGILNTVLSSLLTKAVQPQEIGGILGLSASIESLTRVLAPTLGGILLGKLGAGAPGVFGAVILSLLFFYVWATILGHQQAHVQTATE